MLISAIWIAVDSPLGAATGVAPIVPTFSLDFSKAKNSGYVAALYSI